ncbi:MAG: leucine-rich repeat domain-containing protein [Bacteroidia bacterium]
MQQLIRQMGMEPPKRRQNLSLLAILVGDQARLEKVNVDDWLAALRHSDEAVGIRALKTMAEHWRSPFIGEKLPRRLLLSGSPGRFQVEEARHWLRGKGIELLQGRAKGIDCVVLGLHPGSEAEEGIDSGASVASIGHLEEFCATGLRGWLATPSKASSNATKSLEGLALSHESSNRQLALTMMQSGGVPKHLLPVMLAWAWRGESDLRQFARHWIGQEGPMWMRIFVEEEERRRQRFYTHWRSGRSANVVLEKLGTQAGLFAKALACMGAAGEWAFLPHLNAKDFDRNMLSSGTLFIHSEPEYWNPLPPAFQEPISIKSVQLSKCKYDRWPEGLENVRGLKFLDLGSNSLYGLPQEFARLQELEHLVLNKNRFAEFPEVLFEMGGLKVLEMSGNQLASLPSGFSRLTHLQTIEFEDNAFKVFPESLTELPALFELSMGRKRKTGGMESLPESIGKMENLGGLHLENHRLTQLPEGFRLLSLKRLSLSGNPFSEIPQALLDLKNLRSLHLSNCKRLKALPNNIGQLSELDTLDLQGAGLRKLPPEMRDLGKLRYLNLSDCEFDDFEETIAVIASMPSLQGCPGPSFVKAPSDYKRTEYGYGNLVDWARRS